MKAFFLACCLICICFSVKASQRATIVLHAASAVAGDQFYLGDIATITSTDTTFRTQLMTTPMGRSPLQGYTRQFNEGDVTLKLRQAGIDPAGVTITGPTQLVICAAAGGSSSGAVTSVQPQSTAPQSTGSSKEVIVHPGDKVTLVYDCDGMLISADVTATTAGGVGDVVTLRRDGAIRPLSGIVQDAQTVKMME